MSGRKPSMAVRTAPAAAVAAIAATALLVGASGRADAQPTPVPSVGIFSYRFPSALKIDVEHETVTLPLHQGRTTDGRVTWYVVSESSNQADATQRGVNYSNKLLNAVGTPAVQKGQLGGDGELVFEGTVNFGLTYALVPGPNGFPPTQFAPGAEGDAKYSPLLEIVPQPSAPKTVLVLNAPQVANETGREPATTSRRPRGPRSYLW
jgi:hypothetical protein